MLEPAAYFFDLDGTLLDTERLYVKAVGEALAERDYFLSGEEMLELVYGKSWFDIYTETNARFPQAYPTLEAMEAAIRRYFIELRDRENIQISSSIELLKRLSQDRPVAIVSGSLRCEIQDSVHRMGIASYIQFFLGTEDYNPGKPSPVCYLRASEKMQVEPERCLVFEDSTVGVQAAKAAGMYCVALQRDGAPKQDVSLADWVLSDLADFDRAAGLIKY